MFLKSLKIQHLRNITSAELSFQSNINLITGANGAGKTSLLEAIYLLGRAKSFRHGHNSSPIQKGEDQLTLFSKLEDEDAKTIRLGLIKKGKETLVKTDGEIIKKLSTLASTLPTVLITPLSHRLLDEGPEHRRRILNWGLFHVEHSYKTVIGNFSRSLLQRNNALRSSSSDLSIWNKAFVDYANKVNEQQCRYFDCWKKELLNLSEQINFLDGLDVSFNQGWKAGENLHDLLKHKEPDDKERGYTTVGPQRADLIFKIDGVESRQILSRGQQKVLIILAMLSQAILLKKTKGKMPVFLLDDLASELDSKTLGQISTMLYRSGNQLFIT
ncbi:MAG: DNA replication/repair protein RecF, partial [Candidatus Thiodiazotropha sp.]